MCDKGVGQNYLVNTTLRLLTLKEWMNRVADALSQRPHIFSVIPLKMNLRENILALQIDDDWYKEVKDNIGQDTMMVPRYEGYSFYNDGLLRYNNKNLCTT
jgi:hypothetical protein